MMHETVNINVAHLSLSRRVTGSQLRSAPVGHVCPARHQLMTAIPGNIVSRCCTHHVPECSNLGVGGLSHAAASPAKLPAFALARVKCFCAQSRARGGTCHSGTQGRRQRPPLSLCAQLICHRDALDPPRPSSSGAAQTVQPRARPAEVAHHARWNRRILPTVGHIPTNRAGNGRLPLPVPCSMASSLDGAAARGAAQAAAASPAAAAAPAAAEASAAPAGSEDPDASAGRRRQQATQWTCSACTLVNPARALKCTGV